VTFFSWNRRLKTGVAAQIDAGRTQRVRMCLMLELTAVLVILLCAALMARGFGYPGH
jgi:putative membrane protein